MGVKVIGVGNDTDGILLGKFLCKGDILRVRCEHRVPSGFKGVLVALELEQYCGVLKKVFCADLPCLILDLQAALVKGFKKLALAKSSVGF